MCLRFLLMPEGSSDNTYGRYAQVEELLHLVAEFWDEVDRLRSIQEFKEGVDGWNHTVLSGTETLAKRSP